MAAAASTGRIHIRGFAVVVAAETGGLGMGSFERVSRFFEMVKPEVRPHDIPPFGDVTFIAAF